MQEAMLRKYVKREANRISLRLKPSLLRLLAKENSYAAFFCFAALRRTGDYGAKAPIAGPNPPEASK